MDILFIAAVVILLLTCLSAADLYYGTAKMKMLSSTERYHGSKAPRVTIIISACNEEEKIAQALGSQLRQNYDELEIIAVNDRSTDSTGIIMRRLAAQDKRLTVIDVEILPEGWMGKTHALHLAAETASGIYLLFTDGDIIMEESTIARAVKRMEMEKLDHLCLLFKNISPGLLLNSLILDSGTSLLQLLRPWNARRKESRSFVGVGAFNMVRKEAYQAVGGHKPIRMHPIDDIMLGKIIKRGGYAQECLRGTDLVSVPWYKSVNDMVNGLMKNVLAVVNFRFILVLPIIMAIATFSILPCWALFYCDDIVRLVFLTTIVVRLAVFYHGTRLLHISPFCCPATLITPYISIYIILRAAYLNCRDKGIYWRGTFYPLKSLRRNEPIFL